MKDLNVHLLDGGDNEITIRNGDAAPPVIPQRLLISGNIKSVREFLTKRLKDNGTGWQEIDTKEAVIIIDEEEMKISLTLSPNDPFTTVVTAKLDFTKELQQFSINQAKTFTREELIKLIRFSKMLFDDTSKHESLLAAYQKFDMSAHVKLTQENDTRGNKAMNFDKKLSTNLPTEFILKLPIFKGEGPESFRVEICMDSTDASIRFWFESVELHELIEKRKTEIFERELKDFTDFVKIYK